MGTLSPSRNGSAPHAVPAGLRPLRWLVRSVPTAVVLAALGGAAYWGHATGWDFAAVKPPPDRSGDGHDGGARPVVRLTPTGAEDAVLRGRAARVEFASEAAARAAGIDSAVAWASGLTEQSTAAGEVAFDPTRVGRVSARAGGVTRRVFKAAGDTVRAGEVLALVDSPAVGQAKAEFQQALVQVRLRERARDDLVGAKTVASPAAIREAEAALKDAEVRALATAQTLVNFGLPVTPGDYRTLSPADTARQLRALGLDDVADAKGAANAATLLPVRSPLTGVVLAADVVAGETTGNGRVLFTVVDPSRVWVTLHVAAEAAPRAAVGQQVFFRPDGEAREVPAKVVWVGAAADEATRTVPVRAEADNAAGTLRASTLGRGRLVFRDAPKAIVVPHEAVKAVGERAVVFVRDPNFLKPDGPKAYHARAVVVGGRDERNTEILAGVSSGEVVATKGSDVLLAELTRAITDR